MQFKVPQFLDIEDKIFGPFTFKEFIYLAGGAGLCFVVYKLLGLLIGAIPILIIAGFSLTLTFYKPNNKPFINMLESSFKYFTQNKLYIWKKHITKKKDTGEKQLAAEDANKIRMMKESELRLSGGKLRDLAWSLDILDLSKQKSNNIQ
ncbi:PrgI family protein [Patescibacteria group bacterium]|nr:PrgI family protein [Patescibacteria group bacterium]